MSSRVTPAKRKRTNTFAWASLPDEELLDVRLRDLGVTLKGTWVQDCLDQLNADLRARGVVIQAHGWLSDEWFSPHASPGIAFPFYLAHPRLARLERKMMHEVEGGTKRECMRLLRHEAGHVVQRAYALHRRKRWREVFGVSSKPYPDHYRPNPSSKNYVQHLRRWYAQCHPDEDFAETFAVWMTPRSNWRQRYANWPGALRKLTYLDELMGEIAGETPVLTRKLEIDQLHKLPGTLREHYQHKLERYAIDAPTVFDRDLKRIFASEGAGPSAAAFVRRNRVGIRNSVAKWSGEYPVALDAAFDDMLVRCRALQLRAVGSERKMRLDLTALLATKAVLSLYGSSRRQSFAV